MTYIPYKDFHQKIAHKKQTDQYLKEIYKKSVSITSIAFSAEHGYFTNHFEKFVYKENKPGPLQKYIDKFGLEQTEITLIHSIRYVNISDNEIALYLTFIGKDTRTLYYKQCLIQPYYYEINTQTDSKTKEEMDEGALFAIAYSIIALVIMAVGFLVLACL